MKAPIPTQKDETLSAAAEYEATVFAPTSEAPGPGEPPAPLPPSADPRPLAERPPTPKAILSLLAREASYGSGDYHVSYLISGDGDPIEEFLLLSDCNSIQAYVTGLAAAIALIPNGWDLELLCDLEYITKGTKFWCHAWARNKWRKAGGDPVKYAEVWKEIHSHVRTLAKITYGPLPAGSPLRRKPV